MFDFFRNREKQGSPDVKTVRDTILQFVKTAVRQLEGGEARGLKGIHLFVNCSDADKHLYEAALYVNEANRLQQTVEKMASDYALNLPVEWQLDVTFASVFPPEAIVSATGDIGLFFRSGESNLQIDVTARVLVLSGEAEKSEYTFTSSGNAVTIGREKMVQTRDNFFRENTIAFPAESEAAGNKYISRQHAHIEWDKITNSFLLFADEGGVPPRNKVKIKPVRGGDAVKLQSTRLGYSLQHGDQIILGETALLEFQLLTG